MMLSSEMKIISKTFSDSKIYIKKYPGITENRWQIISRGDLETGMSTVECRLSIGDPIEIELKKDNRFETWFYNGKTLEI